MNSISASQPAPAPPAVEPKP
jgi:hypothetical protein